jgi:hypothetical protein
MKNLCLLICLPILFSSCLSYSRMTSPEVMEPTERTWVFGGQPQVWIGTHGQPTSNSNQWGFTPIIGYRTGSDFGEWGVTLHQQIFFPAVTFDYKHKILERECFHLSGDVAATIGEAPGMQYDLLFGNRTL